MESCAAGAAFLLRQAACKQRYGYAETSPAANKKASRGISPTIFPTIGKSSENTKLIIYHK
jgi:hypothetical protein